MLKKVFRSPITTVILVIAAAGLLFGGIIGGVRAAPLILSDNYIANLELASIDIGLSENEIRVPNGGELLTSLVPEGESFHVGTVYDEALRVVNTGAITEYVRVTVYRYWTDSQGKAVNLDPSLIRLHFVEGNGWTIDQGATTAERVVLYYSDPIAPGESTSPFTDTLAVSADVNRAVTRLEDGSEDFDYNDVNFHIEAVADAVQNHHAEDAMTSAWGRTN